ncbi:MAG TPA: imidazole glycerol phosphate synthase subunit HisF [Phycisphaerales bacterium]|nr:imidazole glycerol phosphate synthase subunit HisF [Phycisphaerales bacterium]
MTEVAVIRTGTANLASVLAALRRCGVAARITDDPCDAETAERLVLPGVGSFGAAMASLHAHNLAGSLRRRIAAGRPTLAICLGLQLLAESSDESPGMPGLGVIPGRVTRFDRSARVPQLGWNIVRPDASCRLLAPGAAYYANSYRLNAPPPGWSCAITEYAGPFVAALERGPILACQFHPELSGPWGQSLIHRWLGAGESTLSASRRTHKSYETSRSHAALAPRIIPCLDIRDGRIVKGVRFADLRDAGDPAERAALYEAQGADELVILDVSATPEARATAIDTVARVRAAISIPLTAGGGVRSTDDAAALLDAGADKVAVNTAAVRDPALLTRLSDRFGAQCIVLALDAAGRRNAEAAEGGRRERRDEAVLCDEAAASLSHSASSAFLSAPSAFFSATPAFSSAASAHSWEVVVRSGAERTGIDAVRWAQQAASLGAGEILLTAFDRDGTQAGYDLDLLRAVSRAVTVPVIASGGASTPAHLRDALHAGAAAVLAASIFHDGQTTVADLKRELATLGVPVRPPD